MDPSVGFAICRDNLRTHSEILAQEYDIRRAHLHDLAHLCADTLRRGTGEFGTLSAALADLADKLAQDPDGALDGSTAPFVRRCDRIWLVRGIAEYLEPVTGLDWNSLVPTVSPGCRVAYVRHRLAEEAFSVLSARLHELTVSYASDLTEACEETVGGQSDLCLLPYRDGEGNLLSSVGELVSRFGLYLNGLIPTSEGVFGLYARGASLRPLPEGDVYLSLVADAPDSLSGMWELTEEVGGSVSELRTSSYREKIQFHLAVSLPRRELSRQLLLYRALFAPEVRITGTYQIFTEGDIK